MWCLSCFKPSTSEDPFEAEIDLALAVSREEADIQEAKQLASALQESSRLQKEHEDEQKKRTRELEKDAQIARAFQYDERDNNSALEDEKHEQPAKIAVESFQDKGKLKQFEEQVKNDEQVAQDLQNRFNKMAYEESPGLLHVLDDKDEQLAKTVKSSKEKRRSKQLEEQVKKDELVAQDLQNRFNKRSFEESHDNAVLDELANTVKSFKEKRKSKQFEEQVKSDEQVAQDLQNLLSEMPYKESAGLHDNSVLGNEGEQFPKTVGRSLKVKGKEKILEDEQVKKDEELALVLQESLNMVEPPPRPRIEERKSIPRRAALDVKKSSKEKGKGKKSEGEQVKKDEELALILQESLNMVEPPPPPPNEEHKSISRRAAFDVQEQLAKEKGKGKQIEDEQVKKDEQLAVIVQESLNMVESPEEDSNISSSRAPMDEDEQRIIWESLKGKGLLTQPEDEVEDVGQLLEANPAPPPSRCGGCYCEIEQERSVDVLGVLWHPECLICGACHNPITIHEVETHVSNLRGKFHKNCYRRYCYVCQEKVKIRMFNKHPFWKENYCPDHDSDGTHKCFSCERLEVSLPFKTQPKGTDFVELDDGRRLCLQCMDSAVMDTYEVQPLHFEIREFFEGLNMKIEREFPFLLVEKQALNKAEEEEKIDNQEDGVVTRGICLSEEQIVTSQLRLFSRDPFPNKLQHYLYRANLIDSIRLTLRSPPVQETDLTTLLNHRLLDSFVVKNALRSSPSLSSAWSIFKSLKKIKPQLSYEAETLHAFATVLAKFHRSSQLKSLIGLVHAGKFGRVQFSFMNLMNLYATASDFDSVLNTWDEFISSGEGKGCCTESYNIVMQVYVSLGKDADAVQMFDQMINNGGIPNSRTFTIMIEHLVKSGNLDAAMEVFETLPSMRITRTLKHYSVLVEAFVDAQRFDQVKTLLAEMKSDGKFPSRRMFEPLKRMREAGFEEETGEFLREMLPDERVKDVSMYSMCNPSDSEEEKEEEEPERYAQVKLKPWLDPKALANSLKKWNSDTVTALEEANFVWTNLLVCKMLRNFRSSETAWSFFCWVAVQPGFTHDAYTIERMMAMLARNGEVELVDKLISKVRVEGIKLPFSTIRLIIDLYGVSKKPEAAIKVFRHDRTTLCGSVSGFNLMLLYSSLLRTLTKCKRNAEALETLEEMVSTGVSPDIQTFSGLMYHFALQGEIQTVQRLFSMVRQIGLEPDPYMLKLLVQAYCRCERSVLAFRVFQDMKDLNLIPDRETKELLVRSLWREEKRKEAAAVEESSYCDEEGDSSSVLRLVLKGHVWNFSSRDIARVYNLYRDCILKTPS
uniref:LIM zinc-binding domain-containing protein n=1 Tax=Brassica campestris TaxID=3711 RepID=A0A3P6B063_BRACM|nr:unnamed protein product [Brassica rapa]